jgi:hypothetical protein
MHDGIRRAQGYTVAAEDAFFFRGFGQNFFAFLPKAPRTSHDADAAGRALIFVDGNPVHIILLDPLPHNTQMRRSFALRSKKLPASVKLLRDV